LRFMRYGSVSPAPSARRSRTTPPVPCTWLATERISWRRPAWGQHTHVKVGRRGNRGEEGGGERPAAERRAGSRGRGAEELRHGKGLMGTRDEDGGRVAIARRDGSKGERQRTRVTHRLPRAEHRCRSPRSRRRRVRRIAADAAPSTKVARPQRRSRELRRQRPALPIRPELRPPPSSRSTPLSIAPSRRGPQSLAQSARSDVA
jgi:hypothetical protein